MYQLQVFIDGEWKVLTERYRTSWAAVQAARVYQQAGVPHILTIRFAFPA